MPVTLGPAVRARLPLPDDIERGQSNTLQCPLFDASGLVTPTSATISITDGAGQVQSSGTATITAGVATWTWTPASTLALGEGWTVSWSLTTVAYGVVNVRNDGALCRVRLTCPITTSDVYRLSPGVEPSDESFHRMTAAQLDDLLSEAWVQVQARLLSEGKRPYLTIGAHALREVTQLTFLSILYSGLAHQLNAAWAALAAEYRGLAKDAWGRVKLSYDDSDSGIGSPDKASARSSVIWVGRGR